MQAPRVPGTPILSPLLARNPSQRVIPRQALSPRVSPRMNSMDASSLRVTHTLPITSVIPLTPNPAAENTPYVPQGMAGMNLFDTFEEEHMETPALPRYNTRSRARQHSDNQPQFLAPRIFQPIAFTNNQSVSLTPTQAPNHIPMANAVINQDSGASLEYRHLIQDETTFPVWNKAAANECGRLAHVLEEELEDPTQSFLSHAKQCPKARLLLMDDFWWKYVPTKLKLTESASLWVAT
jgi:hypothetical protein